VREPGEQLPPSSPPSLPLDPPSVEPDDDPLPPLLPLLLPLPPPDPEPLPDASGEELFELELHAIAKAPASATATRPNDLLGDIRFSSKRPDVGAWARLAPQLTRCALAWRAS
jgi:hypothetical protein